MFLGFSLLVWIILIVVSIIILVSVECEQAAPAILLSLIAWALIFSNVNQALEWVVSNPLWAALGVLGYFGVGVLYSLYKWYDTIVQAKKGYYVRRKRWLTSRIESKKAIHIPLRSLYIEALETGILNQAVKEDWQAYLRDSMGRTARLRIQKPVAKENKSRITSWILSWPWVGLWDLIHKPLRYIVNKLYGAISGTLQRMSDAGFSEIDKDLK